VASTRVASFWVDVFYGPSALAYNATADIIDPAEFLDIDVGWHLKHSLSATPSRVIARAANLNLLLTEAFGLLVGNDQFERQDRRRQPGR
jgi:hypothetical protein